ncbi:hypothetical protein Tco_1274945 [Tanacetum coccineum]
MSKRNLATVTYSLTQSDLMEFVEKYGIDLCYNPQLPSSEQTSLDASDGYISLCLSLFSIANLRLPLNTFCLYVFEFFDCHFPLLNPFGVARVTTFAVVCKAYGGEPTLPLFRSLYTTGPAEMSFRNFMKKPSQTPTFSVRPPDQPIDVDSPSVDHSKAIDDNDQGKSSFVLKNQDVVGFELAVVSDSPSDQGIGVVKSSKKKRSITAALEEGATVIKLDAVGSSSKHESKKQKHEGPRRTKSSLEPLVPDVKEAYFAHNVLSGLHHPSLKNKLDSLSLDDLSNVYDVHALNLAMIGNMLTNETRVMSCDYSKLKSDFLSFRSKNGLLKHEMSKLEDNLSRARKNQDLESSQVVKDLRFREEVDTLSSRLKIADLEKVELVRNFLPLAALDEVHGLGGSWDFKDVEDYNPEAEKVLDEAAEAFYKLDFPYISLLVEKSGESLSYLAVVDPLTIQEAPPS